MSTQLAKIIYLRTMSTMKYTLELEELSYREQGRNDPRYKTFKKHLMSSTYNNLRELFSDLSDLGLIEPTDYDEDVKDGYQDTDSGGSGYINSKKLDDLIKKNTK